MTTHRFSNKQAGRGSKGEIRSEIKVFFIPQVRRETDPISDLPAIITIPDIFLFIPNLTEIF